VKKPVKKKMNASTPNLNPAPSPAARQVGCSPEHLAVRPLVDWARHELLKLWLAALTP